MSDAVLEALVSGDAAAYAGFFREDAALHPPDLPAVRGRAPIADWARGVSIPAEVTVTWPNLQIHGDGSMAYGTADYVHVLEGESAPFLRGKQLAVYRKDPSGRWEIIAVSFNPDSPLGPC